MRLERMTGEGLIEDYALGVGGVHFQALDEYIGNNRLLAQRSPHVLVDGDGSGGGWAEEYALGVGRVLFHAFGTGVGDYGLRVPRFLCILIDESCILSQCRNTVKASKEKAVYPHL